MATFLENIGLAFMSEEEDDIMALCSMTAKKGKGVCGYNNMLYLNYVMGDAQLTGTCKINEELENISFEKLDTHATGNAVWKVRVISELSAKTEYAKKLLVKNHDGDGAAIINIISPEVLPSYLPEEEITMQVVAFPLGIQYFKDEEDYASLYPEGANGKKLLMGDGMVFPNALFMGSSDLSDTATDDIVNIRGEIQGVYKCITKFEEIEEEECPPFIRCVINTQFGKLDIIHSVDVLTENKFENIQPGCICAIQAVLSGDVAIYDYEKGIVKDHENNLHALAYSMVKGNMERLRNIFSDKFHYYSETSDIAFDCVDAFIQRDKEVHERDKELEVKYATVTDILEQTEENAVATRYEVGERCFVLRYDNEENFSSIVFIENDENGNIETITVSNNPRYIFELDPPLPNPEEDLFDEEDREYNLKQTMIIRSRVSLKLDDALEDEEIIESVIHGESTEHALQAFVLIEKQDDMYNAMKNALAYFYTQGCICELYHLEWNFQEQACLHAQMNINAFSKYKETIGKALDFSLHFANDIRTPMMQYYTKKELITALACAEYLGRHYAELIKNKEG